MNIKHPDLPFEITPQCMIKHPNGFREPASPDIYLLGLILMELKKLNEPKPTAVTPAEVTETPAGKPAAATKKG